MSKPKIYGLFRFIIPKYPDNLGLEVVALKFGSRAD